MKENQVSLRGTGIKYGLITAAICIAYFLIMRAAGLINITALRLLNYAFLAVGLFLAFNEVRHKTHKHRIDYLKGIGLGFIVVLLSSMLFSIFIFAYAYFINPDFLNIIRPDLPYFNGTLNPYIVGVYIFGESIIFGAVLNFLIMQLFKRNLGANMEEIEEAEEHKFGKEL